MKYYYKSPEEVRKEIEERKRELKQTPWNKTTIMIFLNIFFLGMIFMILDYTGYSDKIYYKKDTKIQYKIDIIQKNLNLYFQTNKPHTIIDARHTNYAKNANIIKISKIIIHYLDNNNKKIFEFTPYFSKNIIDKDNHILKIDLPENFPSNITIIENVYLILFDTKKIEISKANEN